MNNMIESLKFARRAAVPIIIVRSPDYASTIKLVSDEYSRLRADGKSKKGNVAMVQWDINRGVIAADKNRESLEAQAVVNNNPDEKPPALVTGNPIEAMQRLIELLPEDSIAFMMNLHILLESRDENRMTVIQGVWNMRDKFKTTKRTLVLLVPDMKVPPELVNDVVILDVDLPTTDELQEIVKAQFKAANLQAPSPDILSRSTEAVIGLSQFTTEQVVAMSLRTDGIDLPALWERKKSLIEQSGGLTVHQSGVSFDDIGGLDNIKSFLGKVIKGKRRPRLVVVIDEMEKQMGGLNSDTSGVSMDAFGQLLQSMQDNDWSGILEPGVPGTGKTEIANAMGNEAGGLFIKLDMGGMKDKFVGNSEKLVREAMRTLKAMGGRNVFFVGTTNSFEAIRPELKRRFRHGNYFFDLPSKKEQKPIWAIWKKRFGITDDEDTIDYTNWNGSDIKNICEFADEMGIPLKEAQYMISPVFKTMGDQIDRLRAAAHQRYLSPSYAGLYKKPESKEKPLIKAPDGAN